MKSPEVEMFQPEIGPENFSDLETFIKGNAFNNTPDPEKLASKFTIEIPQRNNRVTERGPIEKESIFEVSSETITRKKPKPTEDGEEKTINRVGKKNKGTKDTNTDQTPTKIEKVFSESESIGTLAELRAKRGVKTLNEKLATLRKTEEGNIPKDTTPKSEKLETFAKEVKKSEDPLALIGLKVKTEPEPKTPKTKEQKLSFLDKLLARLRGERSQKQESISLEELRAKRLEREIETAVAEGNALLDAKEEKLPEKDRRLVQSATKKYREQRKVAMLTERRPEEEYAGIMGDDINQN